MKNCHCFVPRGSGGGFKIIQTNLYLFILSYEMPMQVYKQNRYSMVSEL